jgi:hypothetical protein
MKIEDGERWLAVHEAVEIVRSRYRVSIGKAEAAVREARASGEVRDEPLPYDPSRWDDNDGVILSNDDGVVSDRSNLDFLIASSLLFSEDDFVDWLDRNMPQGHRRAAPSGAGEKKNATATPARQGACRSRVLVAEWGAG